VVVPVALIFVPHALEFQRQPRIPITLILRVTDARKIRHPRRIRREALERHDVTDAESRRLLDERVAFTRLKVGQLHLVADPRLQVLGHPIVEHDLARSQVRRQKRRGDGGRAGRDGVRCGAFADLEFIDQIRDDRLRVRQDLRHGAVQLRIDEHAVGNEIVGGRLFPPGQREPVVGQLHRTPQRRLERLAPVGGIDEQNICPRGPRQCVLQQLDRQKHRRRRHLGCFEREAAKGPVAHDRSHAAAEVLQGRLGAGNGRVARHDAELVQPDHERVAHFDPEPARKRVVDRNRRGGGVERHGGRLGRERPEAIRDAHQLHLAGRGAVLRMGRGAPQIKEWRAPDAGSGGKIVGEALAEETIARRDKMSGAADTFLADQAQRRGHGITGEQGSEQHGGSEDGAGQHARVGEPVVHDTAEDVAKKTHARSGDEPAGLEPVGALHAGARAQDCESRRSARRGHFRWCAAGVRRSVRRWRDRASR
jgi:hypothetical protein